MSHDEHHGHHIVSVKTLVLVFLALVFLTVLTVVLAQFHFGALEVPIAMTIALIKASLVVMIFMALKWDNRVNATVLAVGALFVLVFISFTLLDTEFRGDLSNTTEMTIMDQERALQAADEGAAPAPAA
ncbi:MAG: cytochrome C oxidase subunit IV family protein, partial [Bacteroidetes bacterium]|nr:cytochrome C oxidase subunit IV family protein [Bacteroidota bacterium]